MVARIAVYVDANRLRFNRIVSINCACQVLSFHFEFLPLFEKFEIWAGNKEWTVAVERSLNYGDILIIQYVEPGRSADNLFT